MGRSREEIQKEYDDFYTANPNKWGGPNRSNFMIKMLDPVIPSPKTVLDFGCGQGVALENYHNHNPYAKLYGIDISPVAIELTREKVPGATLTTENEFKDIKTFDLIWCLGTAEHMEDLSGFLKDMSERLNPFGVFYLEVPNCLAYCPGSESYRRLSVGSHQVEWHLKRKTWEEFILKAGFQIVKKIKGPKPSWEFIWLLT